MKEIIITKYKNNNVLRLVDEPVSKINVSELNRKIKDIMFGYTKNIRNVKVLSSDMNVLAPCIIVNDIFKTVTLTLKNK